MRQKKSSTGFASGDVLKGDAFFEKYNRLSASTMTGSELDLCLNRWTTRFKARPQARRLRKREDKEKYPET
jgi:hypothetical protein